MGRILLLIVLSGTSLASLARPWIGVVAAYFIAILSPQTLWWWNFEGLRPAYWVILPTLAGLLFAGVRKELTFSALKPGANFYLLALWAFFLLSYIFGPYTDAGGPDRFTDPSWAIATLNKIFLLYFVACICIDNEKKLRALVYVAVGSGIYLIFWGNYMYLSGQAYGRLAGPTDMYGVGPYADENSFALLFVTILPFLWFLGFSAKNRFLRWGLWLLIPLGWHAVFLTGSRGGLIGIAATLLIMIWRSKNKVLGALLIPAFAIAFYWQAGDVMRERATTISDYSTEESAAGRLDAWQAAIEMMKDNPLFGVGLASFGPAFSDYSSKTPREAHNTFFQIAGESGVLAGVFYLLVVSSCLLGLWRNGKRLGGRTARGEENSLYWLNEAILSGYFGLVVCSLFLSMQQFEIFYFMCVLVNSMIFISSQCNPDAGLETGGHDGRQRRAQLY